MYVSISARQACNRKAKLKQRYGISPSDYAELLAVNDGRCHLCNIRDEGKYGSALCVDHNHVTGEIRGLLCHNCNTSLGKFDDDVEILKRAIRYLEGTL